MKEIGKDERNKIKRKATEVLKNIKPGWEKPRNSNKAKTDLKKLLLKHYKETSVRINVRLDIDAAVEDIYEKPKLILKNKKDNDEEISEINQMFMSDNGARVKTVFVEGEPGSGKTTLCKKIVHDWCKFKQDGHKEKTEDQPLSQFEFLFYVRLREVEDQCNIKEIIYQCLIEQIQSDDKGSKELLSDILRSEHCLLLLDGLDEFKHCGKCKRVDRIPHVESCWINCTTFITTRPYKLAELKLSLSQIGKHVQLKGVQSPKELVRKVIKELEKDQVENRPDTCVQELKEKGLWHFRCTLIVLVHIAWLWFKNKLMDDMPLYVVLREIIQERWYEMCKKKNIEANKLPDEFLYSVSELAFSKLFSDSEDDSIVFEIEGGQLEKFRKYKQASLQSGILSCSNRKGEISASYQFLHKTLQEYLAALYLAKYTSDLSKDLQHIKKVYINNRIEGVLSLGQMFKFLCGLSVTAAKEFSKTLNDLFTTSCERDRYFSGRARQFQDMINDGYQEAERSGHTKIDLYLQHIVLSQQHLGIKHSMLKQCLDERKSSIVSLAICYENDFCSHLQSSSTVLDLGACKNLKFLEIYLYTYNDIIQLNLNGLLESRLNLYESYESKLGNILVSSFLSSDLTNLKGLDLRKLGWESKAQEIVTNLKNIEELVLEWRKKSPINDSPFDLGHLKHLKKLRLIDLAFSDVLLPHTLDLCTLYVSLSILREAPQLIAALQAQIDYSSCSNQASNLEFVYLERIGMSAVEFIRLVRMMIQSGHYVEIHLWDCVILDPTVEPEKDVRQLEFDMDNQPGDGVGLKHCTVEPEEDVRQLEGDMENQSSRQIMALHSAFTDYKPVISLTNVNMSAVGFRRLVSMVIQAGHSVKCMLLSDCTIEPEKDVRQLEVDMNNQSLRQVIAPHPAFSDFTTEITVNDVKMSAVEFRRLVSMVIQAGHSVKCEFMCIAIWHRKDVKQLDIYMDNQSALQIAAPHPAFTDYTTEITLHDVNMSAVEFRRLVRMVILAGHSVDCALKYIKIWPKENMWQLEVDMDNQPALHIAAPYHAFNDYTTK